MRMASGQQLMTAVGKFLPESVSNVRELTIGIIVWIERETADAGRRTPIAFSAVKRPRPTICREEGTIAASQV